MSELTRDELIKKISSINETLQTGAPCSVNIQAGSENRCLVIPSDFTTEEENRVVDLARTIQVDKHTAMIENVKKEKQKYEELLSATFKEKEPATSKDKYIPKDLDDALRYIIEISDDEELAKWAAGSEKNCMGGIHMGPAMALRNNWGLWGVGEEQTEIYKWFTTIGITMGDDLSAIIYHSLHRHMNNQPIDIPSQTKRYWKHWKKSSNSEELLPPNIKGCSEEYLKIYNEAVEAGEI